jgi:hypothetical protein
MQASKRGKGSVVLVRICSPYRGGNVHSRRCPFDSGPSHSICFFPSPNLHPQKKKKKITQSLVISHPLSTNAKEKQDLERMLVKVQQMCRQGRESERLCSTGAHLHFFTHASPSHGRPRPVRLGPEPCTRTINFFFSCGTKQLHIV